MTLTFDANEAKVIARSDNCFRVTVDAKYQDEVLENFTPQEIIDNYDNLEDLYELLKEKFEK
jgi:hypothetical protein